MLHPPADRAPIAVRGIILVAASVLFGTAAHVAASSSAGLRLGPVLVTGALVALSVSAIVACGAWLAHRTDRRGAAAAEDMSGGLGLVTSQLLVHWLSQPAPIEATSLTAGHLGHADALGVASVHASVHSAHTGWGMAVAHASAALVVGLLLRWLEACVVGLGGVVRNASRVLVAFLRGVRVVTVDSPRPVGTALPGWDPRVAHALNVLRTSVVRRGPPERTALA